MATALVKNMLEKLAIDLAGELQLDEAIRLIYATDASAYREVPIGVAFPKTVADVQTLVAFANESEIPLIPRAAGTSLAGQVVGSGLVVDVSRHMTSILELNEQESWVRVQPGVVLDELNLYLKPYNLFFAPETSTANRCTIGGMIGNNSCGTHSLVYGSTRDHLMELHAVLSDGQLVHVKELTQEEYNEKSKGEDLESKIYAHLDFVLKHPNQRSLIENNFPKASIYRRNTGYALDSLLETSIHKTDSDKKFNLCSLLAGSEGTLAFTTEAKLKLLPLPPPSTAILALHCDSIKQACLANIEALKHAVHAVELMDDMILELATQNPEQRRNSDFVVGRPKALLLIELAKNTESEIKSAVDDVVSGLRQAGFNGHCPVLFGEDGSRVWELRKAGLGVLGNMVGDAKPVALTEDTAVSPEDLPEYIEEFEAMMKRYGKDCVYYAHISAGELHLRPVMDLKKQEEQENFRNIGRESAELVKKYKGSLSGEHGDGRLRGEFIPLVYGKEVYDLFVGVKKVWDERGIFNPNKIVDTPAMNTSLRYQANQQTRDIATVFDFSKDMGILRAIEKCNGTAACRKTEVIGGTMCPSYMATRNEKDSTRARANVLREYLTNSPKENPFDHEEIKDVLDLCLSCKACKTECPSSVDMTKLKAEFLQHYYDANGIPRRTKMIAHSPILTKRFSFASSVVNKMTSLNFVKSAMGFATERSIPKIQKQTLEKWYSSRPKHEGSKKIYLFNDEFVNLYDVDIGKKAIHVLEALDYSVELITFVSGRTHLSKGLLREAQVIAKRNVSDVLAIYDGSPIVGIEPSALYSLTDEYIDLLDENNREKWKTVANNCFVLDDYLYQFERDRISEKTSSTNDEVLIHGHCMQKAMGDFSNSVKLIKSIACNAREIPSGCCGMAGSFGMEKEHFDLSMKIGSLVLFPAIKNKKATVIASGTSCRHQIFDGTDKKAIHAIEFIYNHLSV